MTDFQVFDPNYTRVDEDSPLVKALLHGRILVVDEFDKAPAEVVCVLKGLLEDWAGGS